MRALDLGETLIITRNGVPVGELAPIHRPRLVAAEAAVAAFAGVAPIDFARFRADVDELVDQEFAPRE